MDKEVANEKNNVPAESFLIHFIEEDDENPKEWPMIRKWMVTGVLSVTGFNRIMVSTIMAPALTVIGNELRMSSEEAVMAMSVFLLATAFGPLFIAPLSETYGRKPILHATNVWFLLWNIVCGFAHSKGLLIAARLLAGLGASAIYALAGGVLGDVWRPDQRGRSIGLYLLIPLLGAAVGPIVGGFITQGTDWRWIFWSTSILQAIMIILSILLFRETHAPTILRKRAVELRRSTGDERYHTQVELSSENWSVTRIWMQSLSRPLRLLFFHRIIQIQACLSAFSYGILYLVLSTFSDLFITQYHQSISVSGLHYFAICIGEVGGAQVAGPLMDYTYRTLKHRTSTSKDVPEFHLSLMIPGAIITPLGLFLYGWAAEKNRHWVIVDVGAVTLSFGMQISGQALQAYVIDCYPDHTSSASAASQLFRSLTAFGFPLFAPKMYSALGYGWGNSILAIAGMLIGIPAPLLLWVYGVRIRSQSQSSL